jgi:hypothetical protein
MAARYGESAAPSTEVSSIPFFDHPGEGCSRKDRLPDERVRPGDRLTAAVETRAQAAEPHRTVEAAPCVVLARPDDLDRPPGRFGEMDRLGDEVVVGRCAAAEAASQEHGVNFDLLGLQARDLRRGGLIAGLELRAGPDLAGAGPDFGCGVHRLHRGVREVGQLVLGLHPLRRPGERLLDVSLRGGDLALRLRPLSVILELSGGRVARDRARVPIDLGASRPMRAAQKLSPSTATPEGISTTSTTPATAFALSARKLRALPPK